VVSAPLKNISQLRLLFPIDGKITNGPNHQPVMYFKLNLANEMGMCITHRKKKTLPDGVSRRLVMYANCTKFVDKS
jgi:hypothetical protein